MLCSKGGARRATGYARLWIMKRNNWAICAVVCGMLCESISHTHMHSSVAVAEPDRGRRDSEIRKVIDCFTDLVTCCAGHSACYKGLGC